jgi:hypothetical protein
MASSKMIRIEPTSPSYSGTVLLPRGWLKALEIGEGRHRAAFGEKSEWVQVKALEKGADAQVSPDLLQALHLPAGTQIGLVASGNVLRFGYVFGLLANVKTDGEKVFGQQEQTFRNLLKAAADAGLYGYVFSPLDIDWAEDTVTGYRLDERGSWSRVQTPLPDVVYDQIVSRTYERRADIAPQRAQLLERMGSRYFNPGYFDKAQVNVWLSGDKRTSAYVPAAISYTNAERAATFLYRHADVYMKPVHGSLGVGIIRLQRRGDGRIVYQWKKKDGTLRQAQLGSISMFLKQFGKRLRNGPYLIQESLRLMTWQGRPFDIRLLLQKDGSGRWKRTKTFCRIARAGDITSNLSTGGDAIAVKELLKNVLGDDKRVNRVMVQLRKVAEVVPDVIADNAGGGKLGELGLDLGLDESGRIWVIEVNAKPWKKPNTQEGEWRDLALLAFQRPVQYAYYLCKTYQDR